MTPRSFLLTPELSDYVRACSEQPDDVMTDLLAETAELGARGEVPASFQIAQEQGVFMTLLTRALGVRRAIEIGTFTGLSALCVARGLADGGRLTCLDVSEQYTAVARRYWARAGGGGRRAPRRGGPPPHPPGPPPPPPPPTTMPSTHWRRPPKAATSTQ